MRHRELRLALLAATLAIAAVSAYHPHWTPDGGHSRFPVHLDEYFHWGYAREIHRTGESEVSDPFSRSDPTAAAGRVPVESAEVHERGFQGYLAMLQATTGLTWIVIFEYAPLCLALFAALAAYVLAERWGAGVEAALWLASVPITLRFLGFGFLVPIALALPLVLVAMQALVQGRGKAEWAIAGIIIAALWPIHAMGALVASLLASLFLALQARSRAVLHTAGLVVIAPIAIGWPYYSKHIGGPISIENLLPLSLPEVRMIGVLPLLLGALGAIWLVLRRGSTDRAAGWALGLVVAGGMYVLAWRATTHEDLFKLYDRTVLVVGVLVAVLAGVGVAAVRAAIGRGAARLGVTRATSAVLVVLFVLQAAAVGSAVGSMQAQAYYRPLDENTYVAYVEAADALGAGHQRAIVDGIGTMGWTAMTGIGTLHVQTPLAGEQPPEIVAFLEGGSRDTWFLVQHDASVVVTLRAVTNPDLTRIADGVYALDASIIQRMRGG